MLLLVVTAVPAGASSWSLSCDTWKVVGSHQSDRFYVENQRGGTHDDWLGTTNTYGAPSTQSNDQCKYQNGYSVEASVWMTGYWAGGVSAGVCDTGYQSQSDGAVSASGDCNDDNYVKMKYWHTNRAWFSGTPYDTDTTHYLYP